MLQPNEIPAGPDVWTIDVASVDVGALAVERDLDAAERDRAARFRHAADRASFVAAHRLLRAVLGARLGVPGREVAFEAARNGKPHLAGAAAAAFNLSHTREAVCCAVTDACDVGVDVERIREAAVADELAGRVLHADERAFTAPLADGARAAAFFRIWALKEAYIKATGEGLAAELRAIAFAPDAARVTALPPPRDPDDWSVEQRFLDLGGVRLAQAVCWRGSGAAHWRAIDEARALVDAPA